MIEVSLVAIPFVFIFLLSNHKKTVRKKNNFILTTQTTLTKDIYLRLSFLMQILACFEIFLL